MLDAHVRSAWLAALQSTITAANRSRAFRTAKRLQDQHAIAVAEKAITFAHRFAIRA